MPLAQTWARALVLVVALAPARLPAQARPAPFETTDVSLSVLADVSDGALHRWWSPGPAVGLGLTSPFHLGSVELGLQYAHPTAHRNDVPGFRSLFIYAGWGGEHPIGAGFAAGGGFRVGMMALRYDGDTLPDFRRRESELGAAVRATVRWMPAGPWFVQGAVSYQSVFTHRHMEQVFLAAGVGRRFGTPAWLRDFLD